MESRMLFGRARELNALEACLQRALAGQGCTLLLSGEAGIGKTRLAEELAQMAERKGASVFWGRAWEVGGAPACWPWVQVLNACARTEQGAAFMGEPFGRRLAPLLLEAPLATTSPDPERDWLLLGSAIGALLHRLSKDRPLVLVFDDLHASDVTSLNLLLVVARELRRLPVLVVGTYREIEVRQTPQLSSLLAKVGREGTTQPLGRLDEHAVTQWMTAALGTEPARTLAPAVFSASEGNPFFVEAISHLLASRGGEASWRHGGALPDGIRETLRELLARLSTDTREVLAAAAVLGRECQTLALELLSDKPTNDVLAAVGEGVTAGVLEPRVLPSKPLRFTHVLMREALYQDLPAPRRIALHAGAARVLARLHSTDLDLHLAEIAHHAFEGAAAGSWRPAAELSARAGRQAMSLLAFDDAAELFERALLALDNAAGTEEGQASRADDVLRAELLWKLGSSQIRLGRAVPGKEACERSAALAMRTDQAEIYARAALAYNQATTFGRVDARSVELLESALRMGVGSDTLRVQVMARLAAAMTPTPFREKPIALARNAMETARTFGDRRVMAEVLSSARAAFGPADDLDERIAMDRELSTLAETLDDKLLEMQARLRLSMAAVERGDPDMLGVELSAQKRLANETRAPQHQLNTAAVGLLRATASEDVEAIEIAEREVLALSERVDAPPGQGALIVEVHRSARAELQDDADGEGRALDALAALRTKHGWLTGWPPLAWWLCFRRAALHGEQHQLEEARSVMSQFIAKGVAPPPPIFLALTVPACLRLGEPSEMQALYDALLPFGTLNTVISGFFLSLGPVAYSLGGLAAALGQTEKAVQHFRQAVALSERSSFAGFERRARRALEALEQPAASGEASRPGLPATRADRALMRVGATVQQYRIDRLLGIGGMATVYAATGPHGRVAIKFMHERLLEESASLQLFRREAAVANQIGHPWAVPVLGDDVDENGCPYLIMPLLVGETVRARWERARMRLPIPEVAVLMADVLDVLASAHAKGIVHRDIKPGNLFVASAGHGCVLDFGIARRLDGEGTTTMSGHMIGTPAFMPPEQALGNREALGPHSDCWAVGATIFSLLTGECVHQADNAAAQLAAAATRRARSLAAVAPHLPSSIIEFTDKALWFEPAGRWPSAAEMRSALLQVFGEALGEPLDAVESRVRRLFIEQLSGGDEGTLRSHAGSR